MMPAIELIERLIQRYAIGEDDAALLRAHVGAGMARWSVRRDRLEARDEAIRAALRRFYTGLPPSSAAKAFARDLDRLLATCWQADTDIGDDTDTKRGALVDIARRNEGRSLGWRQILYILDGTRSG
jgi:hypothetical protein